MWIFRLNWKAKLHRICTLINFRATGITGCCLLMLSILWACSDGNSGDAPIDSYADTAIGASGLINSNYFCRPDTGGNGQLLIHLVGSFVEATTESSTVFARHACAHGFAAVVPEYNNATPARIACRDDDPCHDAFHREILFGKEGAPDPVNVGAGESIVERVSTLLSTLEVDDPGYDWKKLASKFDAGSLQTATVSGHSQGNGHALYWTREEEFQRVVLLGGVADRLGSTDADSDRVTWVKEMADTSATPNDRIYSFFHADEDRVTGVVGSRANLALIGVGPFCDYFNSEEGCMVIEIPSMGCVNPVAAHSVVLYESFSESYEPGGALSNGETWDLLLLNQ
jgi:hypothetical protein